MTHARDYVAAAIEETAPQLDLTDPQPVSARRRTRDLLESSSLPLDSQDDLVLAVSEVVTNAAQHGRPPVHVRGWVHGDEAVVTITDGGDGLVDDGVGAVPALRSPGAGGFGLWLAYQVCDEVATGCNPEGFTVRLVAREPHLVR